MLFKKLKLQNIRSYDSLEIEFPKGSILLAGEIGSGKTSILLGLQFALFGLQPGQKGASILRQGTESAKAYLELEINNEIITLERSIKKSKNGSITQDLNIITYGDKKEELSTSEMKDRVIGLLNYPKEFVKKSNLLYKFTVYTPQEEMKAIIQEKPEVRLDTLRHIFGIDRYKRMKDNASIFLQKVKEQIKLKEILSSEGNLLKEKFTSENERKIALARLVNNLEINSKRLSEKRIDLSKKITSLEKSLEDKRTMLRESEKLEVELIGKKDFEARMKKELSLLQKQTSIQIEFSPERLDSVTNLLEKHKRILEEKNSSLLDVSSKISALESKKESPLKMREKVISIENCPTCFQIVVEEHKEKIKKKTGFEIEEINRELEGEIHKKSILVSDIKKEKKLIEGYEFDKNELRQNKVKYDHQKEIQVKIKSEAFVLDRTLNEIDLLNKKLANCKEKILEYEDFSNPFEKLRKENEEIGEEIRKEEISLATKSSELEMVKARLEELLQEIKAKEEIKEQVNHLRSIQDFIQEKFIKMINLTEKNVMAQLRSKFSQIFSEWFSMLASEQLTVRLDEDFTPIITNQDHEIDYEFLSGGERTAIALAYRLSLNKVLNSLLSKIKTKNIVILDEPTDGFASEQIDKMRDIFDQLAAEQMILVSHEQKIEGFVDHIMRVKKEHTSMLED